MTFEEFWIKYDKSSSFFFFYLIPENVINLCILMNYVNNIQYQHHWCVMRLELLVHWIPWSTALLTGIEGERFRRHLSLWCFKVPVSSSLWMKQWWLVITFFSLYPIFMLSLLSVYLLHFIWLFKQIKIP